jgi:hypothetical protein
MNGIGLGFWRHTITMKLCVRVNTCITREALRRRQHPLGACVYCGDDVQLLAVNMYHTSVSAPRASLNDG